MGKTASVILLRALEDQDATGPLKDVMLRHNGWGIFIGAVNGSILNVWRTFRERNECYWSKTADYIDCINQLP